MTDNTTGPGSEVVLPAVETMKLLLALGRTNHELARSVVHIAKKMESIEPELLSTLNKLIVALDQQQSAIEELHKAVLEE